MIGHCHPDPATAEAIDVAELQRIVHSLSTRVRQWRSIAPFPRAVDASEVVEQVRGLLVDAQEAFAAAVSHRPTPVNASECRDNCCERCHYTAAGLDEMGGGR